MLGASSSTHSPSASMADSGSSCGPASQAITRGRSYSGAGPGGIWGRAHAKTSTSGAKQKQQQKRFSMISPRLAPSLLVDCSQCCLQIEARGVAQLAARFFVVDHTDESDEV